MSIEETLSPKEETKCREGYIFGIEELILVSSSWSVIFNEAVLNKPVITSAGSRVRFTVDIP